MIEYRFRVPSAAVFTLYSYSKILEYHFRVPTAGSLTSARPFVRWGPGFIGLGLVSSEVRNTASTAASLSSPVRRLQWRDHDITVSSLLFASCNVESVTFRCHWIHGNKYSSTVNRIQCQPNSLGQLHSYISGSPASHGDVLDDCSCIQQRQLGNKSIHTHIEALSSTNCFKNTSFFPLLYRFMSQSHIRERNMTATFTAYRHSK
jgi:hypothetical protein